jgi:hypothetical protein
MNPEAQRIAIAEACGWNELTLLNGCQIGWPPTGRRGYREHLPDYLNDLNAMHEAENFLTEEERDWYIQALLQNVSEETCDLSPNKAEWFITHATAAQRAEAFLRAKGLWKNT